MPASLVRRIVLSWGAIPSALAFSIPPRMNAGSAQQTADEESHAVPTLAPVVPEGPELIGHALAASVDLEEVLCEKHFNDCWDTAALNWSDVSPCSGMVMASIGSRSRRCPGVLCGSWTQKNCELGSSTCLTVARMCATPGLNPTYVSSELAAMAQWQPEGSDEQRKLANAWVQQYPALREESAKGAVPKLKEPQTLSFVHIPKTAGSMIEDVGASYGYKWGVQANSSSLTMRDGFKCHAYHVPPYLLAAPNMYEGTESFCVVRHPYERMLSEYRYLLSVDWGTTWETGLHDEADCSVRGLNNWITNTLTMYMQGMRYINDCHMLPQMEFIAGAGDTPACNWETGSVIHLCDMPKAFNDLMERLGHSPRIDETKMVNSYSEATCPELNIWDFDKKSRQLMNMVYYEDFIKLNFEMTE